MKQLILPLLLLLFSVNVYSETYSCVSKKGEQIVLTREGNQFVKRLKVIKGISDNKDNTLTYKILFENEKYIKLIFELRDVSLSTHIIHIDKEKRQISDTALVFTNTGFHRTNVECIVIP